MMRAQTEHTLSDIKVNKMMKRITLILLVLCLLPGVSHAEGFGGLLKGVGQALDSEATKAVFPGMTTITGLSESEQEEVAVGRQIAGNLLGAAPLVKDEALQRYVNLVGRWVASQSERPDLNWHFGVIASDDVNAFAAPGGYIFVTRGLYKLLDSEAKLAGVLAHEVAHVVEKHHYRVIRQARVVNLGGKLLSGKAGKDNPLVQQLIGSGAEVVARGLDKNAEYQADRMGVVLSARAGYDQYAFVDVLQQMGHYATEDDSVKLLFKTHPHPDDRLTHLDTSMTGRMEDIKGLTVADRFYRLKN